MKTKNAVFAESAMPPTALSLSAHGRAAVYLVFGPDSAPQQDAHSADHFIGVREHHRECRTWLFDSNFAALHFG